MLIITTKRITETGGEIEVNVNLEAVDFLAEVSVAQKFYKGCTAVAMRNGTVLVLKNTRAELTKIMTDY